MKGKSIWINEKQFDALYNVLSDHSDYAQQNASPKVKEDHYRKEQFTGHYDRNGKEIYFGDKLRWSNAKAWHCFGTYEIKLQDGKICAIREKEKSIGCQFFKEMMVVK